MPTSVDPFEKWSSKADGLPDVEAVSALIGSIYDCALAPERWDATLADIMQMLRCKNATLIMSNLIDGSGRLSKTVGIEPYWLERMPLYFEEFASWERHPVVRDWPLDEPQVTSRHLPAELFGRSLMVKEWGEPQGLIDSMALVLMHSPTRHAQIGLGRHKDVGLVTEREVVLGRLLAPHIRRAMVISDLIDVKTVESECAGQTLDALNVGIVMTDAKGGILHTNSAAETMMRAGGPIREKAGMLGTNLPIATQELRSAIAIADRKEAALDKAGLAVRLTDNGEPPVLAHVLPLKQGGTRPRLGPRASAAVFVGAVSGGANGAEAMSVAYRLTRMETRVLTILLAGQTLKQAGDELGIARTTARTHLDNLLAKTGASRQTELIRLAMQMAPILR